MACGTSEWFGKSQAVYEKKQFLGMIQKRKVVMLKEENNFEKFESKI